MPSPFPGMDPYLEAPDIWPDFHNALAGEIRIFLNGTLPPPYFARLEMRPEIGIVEIRNPTRGHHLITLIELVSPANKRSGPDRQAYFRKQQEVLGSNASLVEIDLLREGKRLLAQPELEALLERMKPAPHYVVLVNRAWKRVGAGNTNQVFPILLTEALPCIPVPLRESEADVPLDLQYVMHRAYDGGPYRRGVVDYRRPPTPPIPAELSSWASQVLAPVTNGPS